MPTLNCRTLDVWHWVIIGQNRIDHDIVDFSGWLAYFADEPSAKHFQVPLNDSALLAVPTVTIYEEFKVILRESNENDALHAVMSMQKGTVVDLTPSLSLAASKLSLTHHLPMADSLVLATAQEFKVILWTQDADLKDLGMVKYFPKKQLLFQTAKNHAILAIYPSYR